MSKQINQYTKTRTYGTISVFDLLDFDSTEDSGTTFESAKCSVLNLLQYLQSTLPTLYGGDGTLSAGLNGDRNITSNAIETKFLGGDVTVEMIDGATDFGFLIRDDLQNEKARLGFDQSNDSGVLEISDNIGVFFNAFDGKVGIGISSTIDRLAVKAEDGGLSGVSITCPFNPLADIDLLRVGPSATNLKITHKIGGNTGLICAMNTMSFVSTGVISGLGEAIKFEQTFYGQVFQSGNGSSSSNPQWDMKTSYDGSSGATGFSHNCNLKFNTDNASAVHYAHRMMIGSTVNVSPKITGTVKGLWVQKSADFTSDARFTAIQAVDGQFKMGSISNPEEDAIVDLESTTMGFLPPRMSTVERDALDNGSGTTSTGLVIYNLTTNKLQCFNGTIWNDLF